MSMITYRVDFYRSRPIGASLLTTSPQQGCLALKPSLHHTTCCQTGWLYRVYSRLSNRLCNRLSNQVWQPVERIVCSFNTVVKPCLSNRLYNPVDNRLNEQCCSFNTVVKPVVKPVWQPVWQPVGCFFTRYSRLSNRLYNRFDNRLYRVNGVWEACTQGLAGRGNGYPLNTDLDRGLSSAFNKQVVKVIWHKDASPPHMDGSIVFAMRH